MFLLAVGLAPTLAVHAAPARLAGPCTQPPQPAQDWLFNGYNNCGVLNGGKPAVFSLRRPAHIYSLADYHYNFGAAVKPGTIGVEASNGYLFGPFPAKPDNAGNWIATVNLTLPAGTYTIVDSNPATWSQNPASGGRGFVRVFGTFVASAPPVPTPSAKHPTGAPSPLLPTCDSSPPSTYLISPSQVAPGGTTSFLLSCQKPVSLGFKGSFAPLKVLIYDEASFRNLRYVSGYLQPISASLPVRPPLDAPFKVAGPDALDVTLPGSMLRGSYIAVIVDSRGDVASQNILVLS